MPPGDKGYEDIHKGKKDIRNKDHRGTNRGYSCFLLRRAYGHRGEIFGSRQTPATGKTETETPARDYLLCITQRIVDKGSAPARASMRYTITL